MRPRPGDVAEKPKNFSLKSEHVPYKISLYEVNADSDVRNPKSDRVFCYNAWTPYDHRIFVFHVNPDFPERPYHVKYFTHVGRTMDSVLLSREERENIVKHLWCKYLLPAIEKNEYA